MTATEKEQHPPDHQAELPSRPTGFRLFRKLIVYHAVLSIAVTLIAFWFPNFFAQLPIGGVTALFASGDVTVAPAEGVEVIGSLVEPISEPDQLGYARQLVIVLIGLWLLMLPVSWVHKGVHRSSAHDHSLDETTLILPGIVAAIVLVVQHSLALAFSLAGIIAGVQFRRALQDTFDALFILVAIGAGIAAGVEALEIAAVLTVFFSYATLYVYYLGDGLESHYVAKQKRLKHLRKSEESAAREHASAD